MTLKMGQELYRRASPNVLTYKVVGIRDYGDSKQYEMECQSCDHGEKCRVLVAKDNYNKLRVIHMLHDDDDYICEQRAWHDSTTPFHETINGVRKEVLLKNISFYQDEVQNREKSLEAAKKHLADHKNSLDLLESQ